MYALWKLKRQREGCNFLVRLSILTYFRRNHHFARKPCYIISNFSIFASLPIWASILNFSILNVFNRKLLSKCVYDAYFRSQEIKTNQISYFTRKIPSFAKNEIYGGHFVFFTPPPISTGSWLDRKVIYNPKPSYEEYYSHTKFQENRIKTVTMTALLFFVKDGGCDVINYVNELKLKRTQLDIQETSFGNNSIMSAQ